MSEHKAKEHRDAREAAQAKIDARENAGMAALLATVLLSNPACPYTEVEAVGAACDIMDAARAKFGLPPVSPRDEEGAK
jgi:hypothetical protein